MSNHQAGWALAGF